MGAKKNIYQTLMPLKLYNLNKKFIKAEIESYGEAFGYVEHKLEELFNSCFVDTCSQEQIKLFEKYVGIVSKDNVNIKNRRAIVKYRLSIMPNDYNLLGIKKAICSVGLDTDIVEIPKENKIKIISKEYLTNYDSMDEIKKEIDKLIPAHIDYVFDVGILTWEMINKNNLSFNDIDSNDFNWNEIELNGHMLRKRGNC